MALTIDRWMAQGLPTALSREMQLNLGGTLYTSLTNFNHVVTVPDEVQNVRHVLVGVLTANMTYTFPRVSGFFFVDNATTGPYVVTLIVAEGGGTLIVNSGEKIIVFVDALLGTIEEVSSGGGSSFATVNIVHADSTYVIPDTIGTVTADSTAGDISIVLPSAVAFPSRTIGVARTVSANAVLITSAAGRIGGLSGTYPLNGIGNSISVNSNGADWWIF